MTMIISSDDECEIALKEINELMDVDPAPDTDEGRRLDELVDAVLVWEDANDPLVVRT